MKKKPLLSIVTVVYNGENFLEKTIQSVISQSYKNWEYIIIDGGSNDGTRKIIKKYQKYLSYSCSEPDKGIYDAMNKGISRCRGTFIGLINASDWYLPGAFEKVASIINMNNTADVIYSDLYTYDEITNKTKLLRSFAKYFMLFWFEMRVFHPTMFVRSEIYNNYQYDIKYKIVSDLKIILQIMKNKHTFIKSDLPLATYSLGGASSSGLNILKEELIMKKDLGYSAPSIFFSTLTKLTVMTYRFVSLKFSTWLD